MGEQTELIMEGTLCQVCGVIMDDLITPEGEELLEPPGHPRNCEDCE